MADVCTKIKQPTTSPIKSRLKSVLGNVLPTSNAIMYQLRYLKLGMDNTHTFTVSLILDLYDTTLFLY